MQEYSVRLHVEIILEADSEETAIDAAISKAFEISDSVGLVAGVEWWSKTCVRGLGQPKSFDAGSPVFLLGDSSNG